MRAMIHFLQLQYQLQKVTAEQLAALVGKSITQAELEEICGGALAEGGESDV